MREGGREVKLRGPRSHLSLETHRGGVGIREREENVRSEMHSHLIVNADVWK